MQIISINKVGNLLPKGKFVLHSIFKNVVNLVNDKQQILSFADEEKYLNPNTLIVKSDNLKYIKNVWLDDEKIEIFGKLYFFKEIEKFNSFLDFKLKNNIDLKTKITKFENDFLQRFNPKSLRFLLDKKHEQNFETSFDKAYVKYIKLAFNEIKNGDFYTGISKIKGAGFGLTPSGDDFIAGMLYAFDVLKHFKSKEINAEINKIREIATGKNLISNSLIYYASKGAYYKRFKDFLEAFLYDEENLNKAFNNLLEIGETSSSDMLTGFFTQLSSG